MLSLKPLFSIFLVLGTKVIIYKTLLHHSIKQFMLNQILRQ
ncbi:hypothetical protein PRABACTJOHN_01110 [Parabacteroides johnsonii DSM 18315]|uniref:Uncharacterized protein n=1 Tax=Parabacteroides johnsonii DSM 18315 TaxID=537006 RepID=B7B7V9_9BACT|nr:hypothetical protein PRABACTJOHN_01110 [Parabacteroides johnsonii DSM 18315]